MAKGPLSGVKLLEYCSFVTGPYCSKLFADLGAEVIKVETPRGDEARRRGPFLGDKPDPELSGLFLYHNTNKLGVTLNLDSPTGRKIFKKLAAEADILIEDRPPGEMAGLGLNYEVLKQVNPSLIMASITPFGQDGPYRDYKAYCLNTYHASGAGYVLPANSPNAEREPIKGGGFVGECDVSVCAAVSILGALFWRNAGGSGQYIDISKQEAEMSLERMNIVRYYELGKSPTRVKINRLRDTLLRCRDGGYVKVVVHPDKQWQGLVEALGTPEWTKEEKFSNHKLREANFDDLEVRLGKEALNYETEDLFFRIQAKGTACAPVCSAEQVFKSPQTKARDFYLEIEHPAAGALMYPGLPYKLSRTAPSDNQGAPLLGQHNEEVYCHRLGYSQQDLVKFKEAGVI
ncbi:CoA transferase [Desulfosporosinus sp. PR]|uniref:CaiB/BaiF CoA transferase family protein n=1 Tax=Candidatus Desulfosporosinus nitrosoreducens TaxID=3401928 RepID=UPI0027FD4915|nr:CoA transferase [Desulfosporosinus sp. PR]MDQ7096516.1 CoA transferase [Desulfosporosinus sp. PR]